METSIPFMGFYYSIHDETLDYALENIFSNSRGDKIDKLVSRAFDQVDWANVHLAYAQKYTELFADKFGFHTLKFKVLSSPKFYNFETDRIFCEISDAEILKIKENINYSDLQKKVEEKFTSRSGFISFYKNDYTLWPIDVLEWDHNQIGTLLETYIESQEDYDQEWEFHLLEDLNEPAYTIVSENIKDERLFKIGDYLREREERQWRKQA